MFWPISLFSFLLNTKYQQIIFSSYLSLSLSVFFFFSAFRYPYIVLYRKDFRRIYLSYLSDAVLSHPSAFLYTSLSLVRIEKGY